jgi:hypothetical protein
MGGLQMNTIKVTPRIPERFAVHDLKGHAGNLPVGRRQGRRRVLWAAAGKLAAAMLLTWLGPILGDCSAFAQFKQEQTKGCRLGEWQTFYWQAGLIIQATDAPCKGIEAYVPVPSDWPEQEVRVAKEDVSKSVKMDYITADGDVRVMVIRILHLPPGEEAKALVTFEIRRCSLLEPENPALYRVPNKKKLDRKILPYLGASPYIDPRNAKIRALAQQIGQDKKTAWEQVEALYDYVREKIQQERGPLKGPLGALKEGKGNHEDMINTFVALCRAKEVPARTVWVPGHAYAEFYLEDDEGKGHWFPCQVAGNRAFGQMPDRTPILQKGDSFRPPYNKRDVQRFMAVHLSIVDADAPPKYKFVRQLVSAP